MSDTEHEHEHESEHEHVVVLTTFTPDEEEDASNDVKTNNLFVACYLSRETIPDDEELGLEINTREDGLYELVFMDEEIYINTDDYIQFHKIFVKNNMCETIQEIHKLIESRVSIDPHDIYDNTTPKQTSRYIITEHNIEWVRQILLSTYPPPPNPNSYTDTLITPTLTLFDYRL